jgi:hypothetical protein
MRRAASLAADTVGNSRAILGSSPSRLRVNPTILTKTAYVQIIRKGRIRSLDATQGKVNI